MRLAWCWSHGRREIIAATPKAGSPIADAILAERALLATPEDTKVAAEVDAMRVSVDPATWERVRAQLRRDPAARARAVASYDDKVNDRIAFYQGLLGEVA